MKRYVNFERRTIILDWLYYISCASILHSTTKPRNNSCCRGEYLLNSYRTINPRLINPRLINPRLINPKSQFSPQNSHIALFLSKILLYYNILPSDIISLPLLTKFKCFIKLVDPSGYYLQYNNLVLPTQQQKYFGLGLISLLMG